MPVPATLMRTVLLLEECGALPCLRVVLQPTASQLSCTTSASPVIPVNRPLRCDAELLVLARRSLHRQSRLHLSSYATKSAQTAADSSPSVARCLQASEPSSTSQMGASLSICPPFHTHIVASSVGRRSDPSDVVWPGVCVWPRQQSSRVVSYSYLSSSKFQSQSPARVHSLRRTVSRHPTRFQHT